MPHIRTPRVIGWTVALTMLAAIAYGVANGGFVDGLRTVLNDPWGQVTMVDLVLGFLLFGAWIRLREGSTVRSLPWWVALTLTGNLAAGIYVINASRRADNLSELMLGSAQT